MSFDQRLRNAKSSYEGINNFRGRPVRFDNISSFFTYSDIGKDQEPEDGGSEGGKGKGKEKETSNTSGNKSDEDLALSDSDDVLAISAKRIGGTENLWDFLAGTTAKKQRVWTREQPIMDGGWEILRCFVDGWETEWKQNKHVAFGSGQSVPSNRLRGLF